TLTPLPKPSVDTGMGLERVAAVMQGVHSNYDIDLFQALISAAGQVTGTSDLSNNSLKVIADHIRACSFLIVDGVLPGNEGRGYVLRRIIRRALRHGYELGARDAFFHKLVGPLVEQMGTAYPELAAAQAHVEKVLAKEEERFDETLSQGMAMLGKAIDEMDGQQLPGDVAFTLYDTYGFPVDLTADILRNQGLTLDTDGFESAMEGQRKRARAASKFSAADAGLQVDAVTTFSGYDSLSGSGTVIALYRDGNEVDALATGDSGLVVLDKTPFYAESGGQVGDTGVLESDGNVFKVSDTQKSGEAHLHLGEVTQGTLEVGDELAATVDEDARRATVLNHSATHLLHAALRLVLGTHVTQKGSLVAPDKLRFDFAHYEAVTPDELAAIESLVNAQIRQNAAAETAVMDYDAAVESGALALFGEKYGDDVRVLRIGDFSVELCGGTHVQRAGDIGLFRVTSESGIASGVRRIEAVTGAAALALVHTDQQLLDSLSAQLRSPRGELGDKLQQMLDRQKALEKEIKKMRADLAAGGSGGKDLTDSVQEVAGIKVLAARLPDDTDAGALRDTVDKMKDKLGTAVVVLGAATADGKVRLAAGVTKDTTARVRAGDLVRTVAEQVDGKGGGRPDFAQAGGNNPAALDAALASVRNWVESSLSA
ncbi:MAG: alanine--tRNA ligase, partial [Gammaproteobacteria bacterium]|nr:alanine--tRNA ligase [Gammaproteobacteria bacterium]